MTTPSARFDALAVAWRETVCTRGGTAISHDDAINDVHARWNAAKAAGQRVFVIGNGGSAGIASHHGVDLVNVVQVSALALVEPGVLTCMGNDYGYDQTFARPLAVHTQPGDIVMAVSSSGRSANVVQGCTAARERGAQIITLSGFSAENPLRSAGDVNWWVASTDYGIIETAHFFILHTLIDLWKTRHGT